MRRKRTKEFVRNPALRPGLFHFGRVLNEVDPTLGAFEHEVIAPGNFFLPVNENSTFYGRGLPPSSTAIESRSSDMRTP